MKSCQSNNSILRHFKQAMLPLTWSEERSKQTQDFQKSWNPTIEPAETKMIASDSL